MTPLFASEGPRVYVSAYPEDVRDDDFTAEAILLVNRKIEDVLP